ncbi:carboxypeptidase regulatory-like domain-containing protein [Leifsonia sp. YAF41]|uniref:carboxypeptidase regulatory-like domain-containing protein n=1 Tax=Leifsonia sp. YAF41 TaxID=3233086 RepID=UPI003F979540
MKKTPISGLRRLAALGVSLAMVGGLSLAAAAPASAVQVTTYTLTGSVLAQDTDAPLEGADVTVEGGPSTLTDANGVFSLSVEPGTLSVTLDAEGYQAVVATVSMPSADIDLGPTTLFADEPEAPATYSISGVVTAKDANPAFAPTIVLSGIAGSSPWQTEPDAEGNFTFERLDPSADLSLTISAEGYGTKVIAAPITDADVTVSVELLANLTAGTVTITGTHAVGSTLTAVTAGWPAGTTFSYAWGAVGPYAQNSGDIEGANASTLPVTADIVNKRIWVQAIGHLDGFADGYSEPAFTDAPQLPIAAPPVANSSELAAFLEANGSTPASQTSVGLPAGALDPTKSYTANVPFAGSDDFVDVFLYSSPISVGTFPVVNGVAQVTLSAKVLGQLAAGSHTLVVVGQFTGTVSSVAISVSAVLAETGSNAVVPITASALLLLLGGALVAVRRRRAHV